MDRKDSQNTMEEEQRRQPNPAACETCLHRACVVGGLQTDSPDTESCGAYPEPGRKPGDVYWEGADCPSFARADDKALAMILGVAVGDALGVPVEGMLRDSFHVTGLASAQGLLPRGLWSDDTSLTLALADALLPYGDRPDLRRIASRFIRWLYNGDFTPFGRAVGIGRTTMLAIRRLKEGAAPEESGGREEGENGNGSLMRISPLTFFMPGITKAEDRFAVVRDVSSITHAHEWSVAACHIYVEMLNRLREGMEKGEAYADLRAVFARGVPFISRSALDKFARILREDIRQQPREKIRGGFFVVETLEAAFWCFLTTDSYPEAVLRAVNLGNDTDTTAAVTGAMAGLAYGLEGIPREWRDGLAGSGMIRSIALRMPRRDLFPHRH